VACAAGGRPEHRLVGATRNGRCLASCAGVVQR
jgi:hypothetical protein